MIEMYAESHTERRLSTVLLQYHPCTWDLGHCSWAVPGLAGAQFGKVGSYPTKLASRVFTILNI